MLFYLLDAYENRAESVGSFWLFGKVRNDACGDELHLPPSSPPRDERADGGGGVSSDAPAREGQARKPLLCDSEPPDAYVSCALRVWRVEHVVMLRVRDDTERCEREAIGDAERAVANKGYTARLRAVRRRLVAQPPRQAESAAAAAAAAAAADDVAPECSPLYPMIEVALCVGRGARVLPSISMGDVGGGQRAVVGIHRTEWSPVERFLLQQRVRGPCWLRVATSHAPSAGAALRLGVYARAALEVEACGVTTALGGQLPPPPPPLTIASLHMAFETTHGHDDGGGAHSAAAPPDLHYRTRSFSMAVHRGVCASTPLCAAEFGARHTQDIVFHHLQVCARDEIDARSCGDASSVYANVARREGGDSVRFYDEASGDELGAFYARVAELFEREDPDVVVCHGMLRQHFVRFAYEMQCRATSTPYRSFMGRVKRRNFSVSLSDVQQQPRVESLMLAGRLVFDTQLLAGVYLKDARAKAVRSDSLQEFLEAYDLQVPPSDAVACERYRPMHFDPSVWCASSSPSYATGAAERREDGGAPKQRLYDDPVAGRCLAFMDALTALDATRHRSPPPPPPHYYRHVYDDAAEAAAATHGRAERPHDSLGVYERNCLNACYQQLALLHALHLLPFTLRITTLCGNLWRDNLTSRVAGRVEYLLMHALADKSYVIERRHRQQQGGTKKKAARGGATEVPPSSYAGGKVCDAVSGEYGGYAFLVDVESMYPSVMERDKVCITDTARARTTSGGGGGGGNDDARVLPHIVRRLRDMRRSAQHALQRTRAASAEHVALSIEARVLKLICNQCYGCLGAPSFRFYRRDLAQHVAAQGRAVLQRLIDVVQDGGDKTRAAAVVDFNIIYGHTDSLMLHASGASLRACRSAFNDVFARMNELDPAYIRVKLEGVYRKVLLYNRTTYAALRIRDPERYREAGGGGGGGGGSDDNPSIEALHRVFEVQAVGCELVNRQLPYVAQCVVAYVVHQVLLHDAHLPVYCKADVKARNTARLVADLGVFLRDVARRLRDAETTAAAAAAAAAAADPPTITVRGATARRDSANALLRLVQSTTALKEPFRTYKKPYSMRHLRAIANVRRHQERYTYRGAKIEHVATGGGGGGASLNACATLSAELADAVASGAGTLHALQWVHGVRTALRNLVVRTCAVFEDVAQPAWTCEMLGVAAVRHATSLPASRGGGGAASSSATSRRCAPLVDTCAARIRSYALGAQLAAHHADAVQLCVSRQKRPREPAAASVAQLRRVEMLEADVPLSQCALALTMARHEPCALGGGGGSVSVAHRLFRPQCSSCGHVAGAPFYPVRVDDDGEDDAADAACLLSADSLQWNTACERCRAPYDAATLASAARRAIGRLDRTNGGEACRAATLDYWQWLLATCGAQHDGERNAAPPRALLDVFGADCGARDAKRARHAAPRSAPRDGRKGRYDGLFGPALKVVDSVVERAAAAAAAAAAAV